MQETLNGDLTIEPRQEAQIAETSLTCVDVRTLGRYKVAYSEDHVSGAHIDPWNLEMLCKQGKIYPHGGTRLQAYCAKRDIRKRLGSLSCVKIHQRGDFETTVIFDVKDFETVAAILKPRVKRPPSSTEALKAWGTSARDAPETQDGQDASETAYDPLEDPDDVLGDE